MALVKAVTPCLLVIVCFSLEESDDKHRFRENRLQKNNGSSLMGREKRVKVVSMNGPISSSIFALLVRNMLLILTLLALVYLRPEMSPPCARPRASKAVEFEAKETKATQTVRLN